nr:glutamic acid-rich protein-like [Crassostrea gigas]
MCLDDVEPLSDLDSSLLNHGINEEAEVDLTKPQISHKSEKSKMQVSKLPQRVPKKEKAMMNMTESSESCENVKEAGVTVDKESVKAGEMVTKENPKPSKKEKKGRKEKNMESVDRRGTFVLANAKDLELDTKIVGRKRLEKRKRRKILVIGERLVDEADGREELEPMEDVDQTRYFNTDMEMTEVFNFTQQISTESINRSNESSRPGSAKGEKGTEQKGTESRPGSGKSEKRTEPTDQDKKTNTKEESLQKKEESSKKSLMKTKESSGKPDLDLLKSKLEKIKSTDSTRLSKGSKDVSDGKSEKSNERRDSDDGHGKVKLSKSTSEVITSIAKTPGKPRNVFDFGDRTPTVTLDLKSLNDDSESADKEHQKGIESKKGEKIKTKGSPAVVKEPSRQSRRSRSKPRTYREVSSDEEEMEEEDGDVKGQQRSKSRRRFSSGEEVEKSGRRTRSQSRGRKKDEKKDEEEEDKDYEPAIAKKQRQSRGRSRTRRNDDEDEEVKVTKERASRSRTRKAVEQQQNDGEGKSEDLEEVKIVRKTRSRSRARSVKSRAEVMEDEDEAPQEKMSEKCPDQNQKETEIAVSDDNVRRSSKPFLESLRKSTDVSDKVDKEQAKAFLASLVNNKEKDKEPVTSNKHAEVLVPSSSEEEMEEKAMEDGQRISVNESLVEDVQDTKNEAKREEVEGDKCTKGEVEDAEKVTEIKKVDVDSAAEVKKSVKKGDKKEPSTKEKETKVNGNPAITDSSTSDNLPVVNDRLSQFVRERGRPKLIVMEEDDDITFSDFDKLYKHVSAKRSMESEKDGKVNNQEKAVEVKTKEKVGNSEKASQDDLDFKTPSVPSRKSTKSAAKSRSKKSSKKKSKDEEQKSGEVQGSEKENSVEQNVSQSKKKLRC